MSSTVELILIFGIGISSGLRTMTAPAVVAWAARLNWINLSGSSLSFMGSRWAVALFTLGAAVEYVVDLLPQTPGRTSAGPLAARIATGMLTGASLGAAASSSLWVGAILGAIGAIVGAFGGYQARTGLVRLLQCKDAAIAVPEDLIAVGLALLCVSRF